MRSDDALRLPSSDRLLDSPSVNAAESIEKRRTSELVAVQWEAVGDVDGAVRENLQSVKYETVQGNYYGAAQSRMSIAMLLADYGRPGDALKYAKAAHADLTQYPVGATPLTEDVRSWIEDVESSAAAGDELERPPG